MSLTFSDGRQVVVNRPPHWCCLLCLRQFPTEAKVTKHLERSSLHADNLREARASGRISAAAAIASGSSSKRSFSADDEPPSKRPAYEISNAEPPPAMPVAKSSGPLSALEQMELFESRLKVTAKSKPDPAPRAGFDKPAGFSSGGATNARTINGQMDWECGHCGMTNFAKYLCCIQCNRQVDEKTIYVTNRLKEIKQERFARAFVNDEVMGKHLQPPPDNSMRSDGSSSRQSETGRAMFSRR